MRRAARIDENQRAIVQALRNSGCSVQSLVSVGKGCPDLLVGFAGDNFLIEIKNPSKPKADQQLTEAQIIWHEHWRGTAHGVRTVEEALSVVGLFGGRIQPQTGRK